MRRIPVYFISGACAITTGPSQGRSPRGHWQRRSRLAAVPAISVLALALPVTLGDVALAAASGGATISCTNTDPILGPLQSSATLAAGTSGFLQLGGIDGGKGQYIGNCTLNGTIPSGC